MNRSRIVSAWLVLLVGVSLVHPFSSQPTEGGPPADGAPSPPSVTCADGLVKCCENGRLPDGDGLCSGMGPMGTPADCFMACGACSADAKPCAAPLLGDVGYTTAAGYDAWSGAALYAGENVYGPFEAGFSAAQQASFESLGCPTAKAKQVFVAGGIDTATAEQMVAYMCGIDLPRNASGTFTGLLDSCGGHTEEYHFHERLSCLYEEAGGHSTQIGETLDAPTNAEVQLLYGKWEDWVNLTLPELDACGGHYGATPDSSGANVYHYHVQDDAPFSFGCYGPNADGSLVTQAQCDALYTGCQSQYGLTSEVTTSSGGTYNYKLWCPCGSDRVAPEGWGGSPYKDAAGGMSTIEVVFIVLGCACLCGVCGFGMRPSASSPDKADHLPRRPGKGSNILGGPARAVVQAREVELPTATNLSNPRLPRDRRSKSPARNLEASRKQHGDASMDRPPAAAAAPRPKGVHNGGGGGGGGGRSRTPPTNSSSAGLTREQKGRARAAQNVQVSLKDARRHRYQGNF